MTGEHLKTFMQPGLQTVQTEPQPEQAQVFCASFWGGAAAYGTLAIEEKKAK